MAGKREGRTKKLQVDRKLDVPLREVSGICLHRGKRGQMSLIAVGDRAAKVAWLSLPLRDSGPEWATTSASKLAGSKLPKDDPQIEAVCADGAGRVLLLQEAPPRVELVDFDAARVVTSIELVMDGRSEAARSWADPKGSRGEGAVLLSNGHLLVAKEKGPPALIEFGPPGSASRGLHRGDVLAEGQAWPIAAGDHRFFALAEWLPDDSLGEICEDFSDLEIGPDGWLYLLSDQSASIARVSELTPGGGIASAQGGWSLDDLNGKPEGLAFTQDGCAVVALDKRKRSNNLVLLRPAIAD